MQWSHPTYLLRLLQTILKANPHIAAFPLTQSHTGFTLPPSAGNRQPTLADVINTPQDQDAAFAAFSAVWRELTQVPGRPPILFALDGLAHALRPSDYRDPAFERIHSLDFVLLRLFADLLSGGNSGVGAPVPDAWKDLGARDKLVNGAAVLAATTKGNSPRVLSVDLALARRLVEQQQEQKGVAGDAGRTDLPTREPYVKGYDDRAEAALKSVRVLPVAGLDRTEAKALMTYWARSGLLLDGRGAGAGSELVGEVDESVVTERWTVGGGGVVGEMERAVLENARMRL